MIKNHHQSIAKAIQDLLCAKCTASNITTKQMYSDRQGTLFHAKIGNKYYSFHITTHNTPDGKRVLKNILKV